MEPSEAKQVLSRVGKRQAVLHDTGMPASNARRQAIEEEGRERFSEASSVSGRTRRKAEQQPLDSAMIVHVAEDLMNFSALYRNICEQFGWVPNDRVMAAILNPNSGYRLFSAARSEMRKKGYIFTDMPNKMGYVVKQDVNDKKREALQREYAVIEEQSHIEAQKLAETERKMMEMRRELAAIGGPAV
jgi:hypothetical protein